MMERIGRSAENFEKWRQFSEYRNFKLITGTLKKITAAKPC